MVDHGGTAFLDLVSVKGKKTKASSLTRVASCLSMVPLLGVPCRPVLGFLSFSVRPMWTAEDKSVDLEEGPCMCGPIEAPTRS